jgi:hypothetical protein
MAGERLPARFSLRSQLWFRATRKCLETATSHMQTVGAHAMNTTKPNFKDQGLSSSMGPKLRQLVEEQLTQDLKHYKVDQDQVKFDWSESCIEGHVTDFLDGSVENFSGISVFDNSDNLVADGWMEFIHENDLFIVYWEFVTIWDGNKKLKEKKVVGLPNHIWKKLPNMIKTKYRKLRMKK